jgi:hypothetical protein
MARRRSSDDGAAGITGTATPVRRSPACRPPQTTGDVIAYILRGCAPE